MTPPAPDRVGWWRRIRRLAAADTRPLRHREFRLLLIGRGGGMIGAMIRFVALPYQIFHLTHSPLAVGLLGLVEIVPILVLAFLGGALADAHDRRRMILYTEFAIALLASALLANALLLHPLLWLLYLVAAAMAGLDALQGPSLTALLPRLVERDELTAATALSSLLQTAAAIGGPAFGGILIATIGLAPTYSIDVASFAISLTALLLMRASPPPATAQPASVRRIVEGLRYARSRPDLLGTYLVDMVAMFFGIPQALFPALAAGYGGASALGFLYAAPAAGAFLVAATSGWTNRVHRHGMAILLAACAWGAGITAFGLSDSLPIALFFLAIAGGADEISAIFRGTMWNQSIPDALRGRLAGIEIISFTSGPALGNAESGIVASLFTVRISVVSGGLLCLAGAIVVGLALPAFRHYDSRQAPL